MEALVFWIVEAEIFEATGSLRITIALFTPREPDAAGLAKVKVATFTAASLIVPEFSASELVAT